MSDVLKLQGAGEWVEALSGMTIKPGVKGVLVTAGGFIQMEDRAGNPITLSPPTDTVYPLRPAAVNTASGAYILY